MIVPREAIRAAMVARVREALGRVGKRLLTEQILASLAHINGFCGFVLTVRGSFGVVTVHDVQFSADEWDDIVSEAQQAPAALSSLEPGASSSPESTG